MNTTINRQELAKEIHANSVAKGFWDKEESIEHYLMLVITELSEAVEAHRKGRTAKFKHIYEVKLKKTNEPHHELFETYIKDSIQDELSDAYIRLLDLVEGFAITAHYEQLDECVERANKDNLYKESSITEAVFNICNQLTNLDPIEALIHIEHLAHTLHIDLFWHIREKMKYNASRPRLHGKRY